MQCYNNFIVNGTKVPCMYCLACRINKISSWTIRILGEMNKNPKNCFLTLTYNNENIQFEDQLATLRKRHMQLFHKRLRKEFQIYGINFKYFCCGEYGETGMRPHYHCLYIGFNIAEAKELKLENIWGKGNIYYGCVTPSSIRYVLGYIMDKDAAEKYEPAEPPFQISSNQFGAEWIDENIDKICEDGYFTHKGKKISIPKFIKEKYDELKKGKLNYNLKNIKNNKNLGLTPSELNSKIKLDEEQRRYGTMKKLEKRQEVNSKRQKIIQHMLCAKINLPNKDWLKMKNKDTNLIIVFYDKITKQYSLDFLTTRKNFPRHIANFVYNNIRMQPAFDAGEYTVKVTHHFNNETGEFEEASSPELEVKKIFEDYMASKSKEDKEL